MGLGLLFYGMEAMGEAMAPLQTNQRFADLLQSLQYPVLGMLAGAVFTAPVQSSSATIGLAVVMATQGLLSLPAGIAILIGAKIGTGITAVLARIGKPQDAKRAAVVHALFNVLGAALRLPFIPQLAAIAPAVSPLAPNLLGVEQRAAEVPQQIANAATIWAVGNTLIFRPSPGSLRSWRRGPFRTARWSRGSSSGPGFWTTKWSRRRRWPWNGRAWSWATWPS